MINTNTVKLISKNGARVTPPTPDLNEIIHQAGAVVMASVLITVMLVLLVSSGHSYPLSFVMFLIFLYTELSV